MSENTVQRTVGYWEQYFAKEKRNSMLLKMVIHEKQWSPDTRLTYDEVNNAMEQVGGRCLHDTDKCLHNTRRDMPR